MVQIGPFYSSYRIILIVVTVLLRTSERNQVIGKRDTYRLVFLLLLLILFIIMSSNAVSKPKTLNPCP